MTFKRIGDVACRLIADPVKLVAAANEGPRGIEGGGKPSAGRGDSPDLPPALGNVATAPSDTNGKNAGAEAPASALGGTIKTGDPETMTANGRHMPVAVLVSTGMRSVNRHTGSPRPALRRPLLIVVGGMDHHAENHLMAL